MMRIIIRQPRSSGHLCRGPANQPVNSAAFRKPGMVKYQPIKLLHSHQDIIWNGQGQTLARIISTRWWLSSCATHNPQLDCDCLMKRCTETGVQGLWTTHLCLWQGSKWTRTAWPGMSQECSKTTTPQPTEIYFMAGIQESSSSSCERTCLSDSWRRQTPRWCHAAPMGKRRATGTGCHSSRYTYADSHLTHTSDTTTIYAAADKAASTKEAKYRQLANSHVFVSVAIETSGTWNHLTVEITQELGRRMFLSLDIHIGSVAMGTCYRLFSTGDWRSRGNILITRASGMRWGRGSNHDSVRR